MFQTERLKQLRKKNRHSQATVAEDLNLTREAYSMYETGKRQPSCENLVALSQYFHVSSDYLIGLSDTPFSFHHFGIKERFIILSLPYLDDMSLDFILSTIQIRHPNIKFHDTSNSQIGPTSQTHAAISYTPIPKDRGRKRSRKSYGSIRKPEKNSPHDKRGGS